MLLAVTHVILADDVVDVGIVDQTAMLLMEEHEQRRSDTLNVGQVDVDEHEADEHEHHEVVNDAHAHDAAHQRRARCEERDLRGGNPQSQARVKHQNDEHGDEQIADLLRNAQLSGQRVILLEEQIVLDPLRTLM